MTIDDLVGESVKLASLPDVCIRLNQGIDDPHFSAKDLADILLLDTALSSVLLKIVNSAFYNFTMPIDTISRAITVVGINDLRNLVFAASAVGSFKNISSELVDMNDFWMHSLYAAVTARCLAKHYSILHPERLFVVGLLHDVGSLLMYRYMPKESAEVLMRVGDDPRLVADIEMDVFGFNHAQVGAALLKSWRLPENIVLGVQHHHTPANDGVESIEGNIVYIANQLTGVLEQGLALEEVMSGIDFSRLAVNEIQFEKMDEMLRDLPALYSESKAIISPLAM